MPCKQGSCGKCLSDKALLMRDTVLVTGIIVGGTVAAAAYLGTMKIRSLVKETCVHPIQTAFHLPLVLVGPAGFVDRFAASCASYRARRRHGCN
jgi:hypothetical protein